MLVIFIKEENSQVSKIHAITGSPYQRNHVKMKGKKKLNLGIILENVIHGASQMRVGEATQDLWNLAPLENSSP